MVQRQSSLLFLISGDNMSGASFPRVLLALATCAMLLTSSLPKALSQAAIDDQNKFLEIKILSTNIRSVARILNREGIQIEPGLLFTPNGRHSVRSRLSPYSDMYVSRDGSAALGGVLLADRITLPERAQLESDTLIIANHVTFAGVAPSITGPHDFHVFALDSISVHDPETVITIDTSGRPGASGIAGTAGQSGHSGTTGTRGEGGSCSVVQDAEAGEPGTNGTPGEDGGAGSHGSDGTDAGDQTIMFGSTNGGSFKLIAIGGDGGKGGSGSFGGNGGKGGNGGQGGDGAGCHCNAGAIGDGGTGGAGGEGGIAGTGGEGGNGGNGGSAGTVVITVPSTYNLSKLTITARGGSGGQAGAGGSAGLSGAAGNPGTGGHGCDKGRNGGWGPSAREGAGRRGGNPGMPGHPGSSGSIAQNIADFKNGRGRINWGYEPGATREKCTEWFSGPTLIGCY